MAGIFSINETINTLKAILEKHKDDRVCVIGTMCCGKTTLINQLPQHNCIDADDEFWPQISEKEIEVFSQTPITADIFSSIHALMCEKITVKPGYPLFGVAILDCEAVVYLDIPEKLLEEHCKNRGDTSLDDALFIKKCVEDDWNKHIIQNERQFYYVTVLE